MQIAERVRTYIVNELILDEIEEIPDNYDIVTSGLIDSLSLVRLVSWVENEFDISTATIDLAPADFATITKISEFIKLHSSPAV